MKTFYIDDISKWHEEPKKVEAENVQEALKIALPDRKLKRDFTNTGDIVVKAPYNTRYGIRYKSYVYCDADSVVWSVHTKGGK